MKIAICQINTITGNISHNSKVIRQFAAQAKEKGADIAVFPELAVPGGFAKDLYLRKDFLSACDGELEVIAKECPVPVVLGTVYEGENAVVYIKAGKITRFASKNNSFEGLRYFKNNDSHAFADGISACVYSGFEDLMKAAQKASNENVKYLIVTANDVFYMGRLEEIHNELKECASKQNINIVFVNMCGAQDGLVSYGRSIAVTEDGIIIAAAESFEESMTIADFSNHTPVDCEEVPYELQAYDALVSGLKDYALKNGFSRFVIGISGGVDSALVAVIAKDALGSENVTGIFMPSEYTSNQSKEDAELLCKMNGIRLLTVPINDLFDSFKGALSHIFVGKENDLTEENMQSRIRAVLLMAYSNKFNALLVNTGNKSESAAGYSTLYGDSAGGYAAISDLSKTFLYKICEYRNSLIDSIPKSVLEKEPTAELRPNQKDTDSLPPYEVLDGMIVKYFATFNPNAKSGMDISGDEKKIFRMIDRTEYKRQQAPMGTKISKKSFIRDLRIPVTNGYRG